MEKDSNPINSAPSQNYHEEQKVGVEGEVRSVQEQTHRAEQDEREPNYTRATISTTADSINSHQAVGERPQAI